MWQRGSVTVSVHNMVAATMTMTALVTVMVATMFLFYLCSMMMLKMTMTVTAATKMITRHLAGCSAYTVSLRGSSM